MHSGICTPRSHTFCRCWEKFRECIIETLFKRHYIRRKRKNIEATETGIALIVGIVGNFIFGALMMAGVGLYAPCLAMVSLLGMDPKAAFPIMMGSCAGLMAIGSPEFIKAGNYSRIGSVAITIGGVIGVTIAYTLVKSMPLAVLTSVIIGVVIVTGISMIRQGTKKVA